MKTCLAALFLAVAAIGCETRNAETTLTGSRKEDVFRYENGQTVQTDPTNVGMTTTWK